MLKHHVAIILNLILSSGLLIIVGIREMSYKSLIQLMLMWFYQQEFSNIVPLDRIVLHQVFADIYSA